MRLNAARATYTLAAYSYVAGAELVAIQFIENVCVLFKIKE